jgi:uncharacterized protein
MTISVIIPVWNDCAALRDFFDRLPRHGDNLEFVVADSSEDDESVRVASSGGAVVVRCPQASRGAQMNAGARAATGDVLVFCHADTELRRDHLASLRAAFAEPDVMAAAFYKDLPAHYPRLAWADPAVRLWTRHLGPIYGDQSPAIRRSMFFHFGGFADIPIMEDVEFSRRLRRTLARGTLKFLDPPLRTSMRRFDRRGKFQNRLQNLALVWLWKTKFLTPEQIHAWYYTPHRAKQKR